MPVSTAYAAVPAPAPGGTTSNPLLGFTPLLVLGAIMYLLVIRPQQKQAKEHKRLVDNLKAGDRVLTQGGIYGTVANLKGTTVILKIADNVKVEVSRSAITQVIVETSNGAPVVTQGQPVA